ncbi:MAG: hypothetical protein RIC19_21765, partial [Phaeodactylibacter sp.]|uniref:hypothetical protein n=1 Tax=Phaeodactylibacter sp. TaxID=1940289 RepID=UPI0032EB7899
MNNKLLFNIEAEKTLTLQHRKESMKMKCAINEGRGFNLKGVYGDSKSKIIKREYTESGSNFKPGILAMSVVRLAKEAFPSSPTPNGLPAHIAWQPVWECLGCCVKNQKAPLRYSATGLWLDGAGSD